MDRQESFVILSAELETASPLENLHATATLSRQLREMGASFLIVDGVYKGVREVSFLVVLGSDECGRGPSFDTMSNVALNHGQESILHVDANRFAEVLDCQSRAVLVQGKFKQIGSPLPANYTETPDGRTWGIVL